MNADDDWVIKRDDNPRKRHPRSKDIRSISIYGLRISVSYQ